MSWLRISPGDVLVLKRHLSPRPGRGPAVTRGSGVIVINFRYEQTVSTELCEFGETLGACSFLWAGTAWRAFVLKGHGRSLLLSFSFVFSQRESVEFSVIGGRL